LQKIKSQLRSKLQISTQTQRKKNIFVFFAEFTHNFFEFCVYRLARNPDYLFLTGFRSIVYLPFRLSVYRGFRY